jgi:hypothetical protein
MIEELDMVVLLCDTEEYGLASGDVGAVVHRYGDDAAYEVEFTTGEGKTVAVLTLESGEVRRMGAHEILHARARAA